MVFEFVIGWRVNAQGKTSGWVELARWNLEETNQAFDEQQIISSGWWFSKESGGRHDISIENCRHNQDGLVLNR